MADSNNFPTHIRELLIAKQKELVRLMDSQGFTTPQIAYVFKITKGRVSQILNENKQDN